MKGPRAAEMVTGLVTNDVAALAPGQGCYAAALTAKGKIVADVRVFVEEDGVLVDAPPRAAAAWAAMVRKFVNPRIAPHADESATLRDIGVFGATRAPRRQRADRRSGAGAHRARAVRAHERAKSRRSPMRIATRPRARGRRIRAARAGRCVRRRCGRRVVAAGATPAGLEAWDIARVEAGRPEWGVDMDDNTIPQEANFDALHAISYTKGCYVGQETVARVHFRGHVNKHLRGVRAAGMEPIHSARHAARRERHAGRRRSERGALARLGAIALAMIRREVEPGAALIARSPGEGDDAAPIDRRVDVAALPFSV